MSDRPDNVAQAITDRGLALHQGGRLDEARQLYIEALNADPTCFDALHMLGVLCIQTGLLEQGATLITEALRVRPDVPNAHGNLANVLSRLGRHDEALACCARAITLAPDFADAYSHQGLALTQLGRSEDALASYVRLAALRPGDPQAHFNQAVILRGLGRLDEALDSLGRGIALRPDLAEAHGDRGGLLLALHRPLEALAAFDQALALRPNYPEALDGRGSALCALRRFSDALGNYDQAIALRPDYAEAWSNRVIPLRELERSQDALDSAERAIALKPYYAAAHLNRASALYDLRRLEASVEACDQVLALRPDLAEAWRSRATALYELRRLDEAMASFERALALAPNDAETHYAMALCRLALSDDAQGWVQHEWRWQTRQFEGLQRARSAPLWLGEDDLTGRTILLHAEQGLGDTLQFCRYVSAVAAKGARVILEVQPGLERLLARLDGVDQIITRGAPAPAHDFQTPLLSLPLALGASPQDAQTPYLSANPDETSAWAARLPSAGTFRVGLCWAGGTRPDLPMWNAIDQRRSLPLEAFAPLADIPGVGFHSLQKGPPAAQLADAQARGWPWPLIHDPTDQLRDFADTAALIANLDLVITCDTAIAHLAGGMGRPVWILNRFDACWRWRDGRNDSPWYPSARLYRQAKPGDWGGVIDAVKRDLAALA